MEWIKKKARPIYMLPTRPKDKCRCKVKQMKSTYANDGEKMIRAAILVPDRRDFKTNYKKR